MRRVKKSKPMGCFNLDTFCSTFCTRIMPLVWIMPIVLIMLVKPAEHHTRAFGRFAASLVQRLLWSLVCR